MTDPATGDALARSDPATFESAPSNFGADAPPALRTVVAAVRAALADEPPPAIPGDPDWDLVGSIAHRHQVVPLAYEGLSGSDAPAPAVEPLREAARQNARRNLQSTRELLDVLGTFGDAGVRAIPFKGPVLAAVAYGDLSRRTFLDLDVLVHPDDVVAAGRVLRRRGYEADAEFDLLGRLGRDSRLLADVSECTFYRPDSVEVELRWRHGHWANPLAASFDGWWRRRATTTLAGREVAVLSPEDRLLLLTTHANKHAWRRLAWLADVAAALAAHDDLDWSAVERRAASWGATPAVRVGVALALDLLASDEAADAVPAAALDRVREDRLATVLADRATARLAKDPLGSPSRVEEVAYDLAATGSLGTVPRSTGRVAAASARRLARLGADRLA